MKNVLYGQTISNINNMFINSIKNAKTKKEKDVLIDSFKNWNNFKNSLSTYGLMGLISK